MCLSSAISLAVWLCDARTPAISLASCWRSVLAARAIEALSLRIASRCRAAFCSASAASRRMRSRCCSAVAAAADASLRSASVFSTTVVVFWKIA